MPATDSSRSPGACPSRGQLLDFARGLLAPAALEATGAHLGGCPRCLRTLDRMEGTSRSAALLLAAQDPYSCEPGCEELRRRALGMRVWPPDLPLRLHRPEARRAGVPEDDWPLPARLGPYRLLEKLGAGGMGVVYRARHVERPRDAALKVLSRRWAADPEARARFAREMRAALRLVHPHVVRATDAGEAGGVHYLVMEYVEGADLGRLAWAAGPLRVADACELARQAARALQHVHAAGLVHRDVKPSNLMLTPGGAVKLLDLGLARLRGDEVLAVRLTVAGQVLGTADYVAPEQAADPRHVDSRADLYSLGCTLYHLLAGRPPFGEPDYPQAHDKLTAHGRTPPPPLRGSRPDVSERLAAVVHRLLAKNPADRHASAAEVATDLAPFTAGADLARLAAAARARAPSAGGRVRARRGVKKVVWGLVAALLVALGAPLLLTWPPWGGSGPRASLPDVEDRPLAWHPLLIHRPVDLSWPQEEDGSRWDFDGERGELRLYGGGDRLLGLGKVRRAGYKVRADLRLVGPGALGVFFGYREGAPESADVLRYQFVELRSGPPGEGESGLTACRGVGRLVARDGGGWESSSEVLAEVAARRPREGFETLAIAVGEQGVEEVRWGGVKLAALTAPEGTKRLGAEACLGGVGAMSRGGKGAFVHFEVMLFEGAQ
jgi:tRNA A-37 threonylcarbamoyl transferase component Bud32